MSLCSLSSHVLCTVPDAALLNSCHSHWLELPRTWENPTQQLTAQSIPQGNRVGDRVWGVRSALGKITDLLEEPRSPGVVLPARYRPSHGPGQLLARLEEGVSQHLPE